MTHSTLTLSEDTIDRATTITRTHELTVGRYEMVLAHTIAGLDLDTDLIVRWEEPGMPTGTTPEEFTIAAAKVPELIAALQAALDLTRGGSAKPLRRDCSVDDRLRALDD